jgi:hypothetical protein
MLEDIDKMNVLNIRAPDKGAEARPPVVPPPERVLQCVGAKIQFTS